GKRLALQETGTVRTGSPRLPPRPERVIMDGTAVCLLGPPAAPSAFWQHDGVDFLLDNYQVAMSRDEVLKMIRSLLNTAPRVSRRRSVGRARTDATSRVPR